MRLAIGAALLTTHTLVAATVVGSSRTGNRIDLKLSEGRAAIEWISESSFRFWRRWDERAHPASRSYPSVGFRVEEDSAWLRIASKYLIVIVQRSGALLRVTEVDGTALLTDLGEARRENGVISMERAAASTARYYGLGPRPDPAQNVRGMRMETTRPFLISSSGYGEFHTAPGTYTFDLAQSRPDRYRIESRADHVDFSFYYGPTPKEILEQHLLVGRPGERLAPSKFHMLSRAEAPKDATFFDDPLPGPSWTSLAETVHRFVNASLSAMLLPAFDASAYRDAPAELRRRAAQLGSVAPILIGSAPAENGITLRGRLGAYLVTYGEEARDRGYPLIHPMPFQFPRDPEAARYADQFMLGDELLVAPIVTPGLRRRVYLPMGAWTDLRTNQVHQGRQIVEVESEELPLFSRNGALFPLGQDPMELHYLPKLGGEFFIFESDLGVYSQVHAGPAGDRVRLEIESQKDREYEWIVHHLDRPRQVIAGEMEYPESQERDTLRAGRWFHDKVRRNLHVRVHVATSQDVIVNLVF